MMKEKMNAENFINSLGLETKFAKEYLAILVENGFNTYSTLRTLNKQDLLEGGFLEMPLGHQRVFMHELKNLGKLENSQGQFDSMSLPRETRNKRDLVQIKHEQQVIHPGNKHSKINSDQAIDPDEKEVSKKQKVKPSYHEIFAQDEGLKSLFHNDTSNSFFLSDSDSLSLEPTLTKSKKTDKGDLHSAQNPMSKISKVTSLNDEDTMTDDDTEMVYMGTKEGMLTPSHQEVPLRTTSPFGLFATKKETDEIDTESTGFYQRFNPPM